MKILINYLLILYALGFSNAPLRAQMVTVQNEASVSLTSGAVFTVTGNINAVGQINNEGNILVSGDYINQGTYLSQLGIITLNGKKLQNFNNNNYPVFALIADGKGEKLINGNLEINGEFNLRAGLVTPFEQSRIIVKDGAQISGGYADSYVNGTLYNEGTGYKFFPIGTNGHYLPLELMDVAGENPIIGYTAIEPNPGTMVGYGLKDISKMRVWRQDVLSGNFISSQVTLTIYNESDFDDMETIVVAQTNDLGKAFGTLGKSSISGDIYSGSVTSEESLTEKYVCIGITDIIKKGILYIPNAFSPKSSNPEEQVVKVYGRDISNENFEFRIFNRWGNILFETKSFDLATQMGWDGKLKNGTDVASGVYNYTLKGQFKDGKSFEKIGSVSLIR